MRQTKKWEDLYYNWKSSGQTQREYCKTKGISFGQFKNQTYKLGISGRESRKPDVSETTHTEYRSIMMESWLRHRKIWVYTQVVDFRKQLDGLVGII
jgi:hypothetical protein